jgi:hypothetical protein
LGIPVERAAGFLDSFATYMRRLLASEGDQDAVRVTENLTTLTSRTMVGVVPRRHSRWARGSLQRRTRLALQFSGSLSLGVDLSRNVPIEIFDRWDRHQVATAPPSFDVLAIVTTFNEGDVIGRLIRRLLSHRVRVHVIDNWSTDQTLEIVADFVKEGLVSVERFPIDGPPGHFEWEPLLGRVEEVAHGSGANWVIHHDADEIRESPWPGVDLVSAFWIAEQWGYNCVDHTVVNFRPVNDLWRPGEDLARSFMWFEFGDHPAHFVQLKAWKPQVSRVHIAASGGHEAVFEGRRVFPYKFVTRHYPIRSQAHGERKIFQERQPRWSPAERAKGWHTHYDHYERGMSFIWDQASLFRWEEVDQRFLLQRLSGVGLPGNPWPNEGPISS